MTQQRISAFLLPLSVVALLSACNLAPDRPLPEVSAPARFKADDLDIKAPVDLQARWKEAAPAADTARGSWWTQFKDATLDELITTATQNNQNLAALTARVEQSRQTAVIAGAPLFPRIDASASGQRATSVFAGADGPYRPETLYQAGLGLSYELDLFGRLRNTRAAALADSAAVAADFNSALLALQADVAQLYFVLRGQDAEIKILREAVALRADGVKILEKRRDAGAVTDLDVAQNVVDLENTRAALAQIEDERARNENALAVLLGKAPADFSLKPQPLTAQAPAVPAGLPSALLERRPDIASAQYALMAANARIGVARAAFFPSLSLTASGGGAAGTLGNVFEWSNRTWAIGPLLSLPIFEGGKVIAENERAKAGYAEAVALYRQQVLSAFQDVEDSLSRLKMRQNQATSFTRAKAAADKAARLAGLRYDSGDASYLEDIEARQSALAASRAVVQTQAAQLAETVQLIRALGGDFVQKL